MSVQIQLEAVGIGSIADADGRRDVTEELRCAFNMIPVNRNRAKSNRSWSLDADVKATLYIVENITNQFVLVRETTLYPCKASVSICVNRSQSLLRRSDRLTGLNNGLQLPGGDRNTARSYNYFRCVQQTSRPGANVE